MQTEVDCIPFCRGVTQRRNTVIDEVIDNYGSPLWKTISLYLSKNKLEQGESNGLCAITDRAQRVLNGVNLPLTGKNF